MPCLNPDILFDIANEVIKSGNQEDIFKFALSGSEPLQAMERIFASAVSLELYKDSYTIGWKNNAKCTFVIENGKPLSAFLMNEVVNSIQKLHVDVYVPIYRFIIEKIIAQKQLISFSASGSCEMLFLHNFIPKFSSTLKHLKIYGFQLNPFLQDSLNLESLTLMGSIGPHFAFFCCKTSTLEFVHEQTCSSVLQNLKNLNNYLSPNLSSVKELIFNERSFELYFSAFNEIMKHFPKLDSLKFNYNFPAHSSVSFGFQIRRRIRHLPNFIKASITVPSKITCSFLKHDKMEITNLNLNQFGYELDESNPQFYCFHQTVQSADSTKSSLLEVQICK